MWTLTHLLEQATTPELLMRALRLTLRGKRNRPDVARFLIRADAHLADLAHRLRTGSWQPGPVRLLKIYDPKPRIIARPSVADRVVHNALVLTLDKGFGPRLPPEDFACRPGMGTHRAVLALQRALQHHRFALHLDVRAYFASVDPQRLSILLAHHVRDDAFLAVVERILATGPPLWQRREVRRFARLAPDWPPLGRGLPIGTATSQYFAGHVYLNGLDDHVKRVLKVPAYVRYVDDLFLFGGTRADLRGWRTAVADWLLAERGLRLKHPEAPVLACAGHLDGLGYRITRADRVALPRATRRLQDRVRASLMGETQVDLTRSVAASAGVFLF